MSDHLVEEVIEAFRDADLKFGVSVCENTWDGVDGVRVTAIIDESVECEVFNAVVDVLLTTSLEPCQWHISIFDAL